MSGDETSVLLLALLVGLVLCIPATELFRRTLPGLVERLSQGQATERQTKALQDETVALHNRVRERYRERSRLESERARLGREVRKVEDKLGLHGPQVPDIVHEVGDPRPGQTRFTGRLTYEAGLMTSASETESRNPIWRHANFAETWASSQEEARQILEGTFSPKLGYKLSFSSFVKPPESGGLS